MDISTLSPEIDNASETSDTACPICSRVVPLNIINEHVDKCLQTQNENEASDISRTPSSGGRHEKRKQSMLNFGSSPPCRESFAPPAKVRKMDVRKSGSRNETEARPRLGYRYNACVVDRYFRGNTLVTYKMHQDMDILIFHLPDPIFSHEI